MGNSCFPVQMLQVQKEMLELQKEQLKEQLKKLEKMENLVAEFTSKMQELQIAEQPKMQEIYMQLTAVLNELKWIRWSLTERDGNTIKCLLRIADKVTFCESRLQCFS